MRPITSSAATLTVNSGAAITAPPVNQTVCEGGPASFSVTATGTGLSYQWRKNGAPISGATNSSFAIPAAAAADAGSYDVVVTGSCGTVTSSAATLTVTPATTITAQPSNQATCLGGSVTFNVGAAGVGLSYQWRKNGAPISGATNSSFAIPSASAADAGSYDVVVTGSCGTATSGAVSLTINGSTSINTHPANQTLCLGAQASFSVAANGTGTLHYQWRKNGAPISGANGNSFSIATTTAADAGG
ncbi:MAG: immunoglobulin domain-containing protein [Acidobacteriota bacterium]